jgi:hypothetical protein
MYVEERAYCQSAADVYLFEIVARIPRDLLERFGVACVRELIGDHYTGVSLRE